MARGTHLSQRLDGRAPHVRRAIRQRSDQRVDGLRAALHPEQRHQPLPREGVLAGRVGALEERDDTRVGHPRDPRDGDSEVVPLSRLHRGEHAVHVLCGEGGDSGLQPVLVRAPVGARFIQRSVSVGSRAIQRRATST